MKKILSVFSLATILLLAGCGDGSSDSGGGAQTEAGSNIPAAFVGVYQGAINLQASASGLSVSDSFPITITVTADGQLRFDGDEPNETATVALTNEGTFSGSLPIDEEECSGTVSFSGQINSAGTNASGQIQGDGQCIVNSASLDVELTGDFSANR